MVKFTQMSVQKLNCSIVFFLLLFSSANFSFAQSINQIAYNVEIVDAAADSGTIVSFKDGSYQPSEDQYDTSLYGVIYIDAAVTLGNITSTTKPVVTSGEVLTKVSSKGGEIKVGDLITTSDDKGVGQKATKSGHVLGKALKDFPNDESKGETGTIPVLVNVNYNQISSQSEGLTDQGVDQVAKKVSSSIVSGNIPNLLKYVFALLLGAISFFVGLSHFVRSNRTAVESIARNPMAKADIRKQLVFGTAGILVVCGIGLAISVWILIFL